MGRRLENEGDRIVQRSIGFRKRQTDFFVEHPEFRPDEFCRDAIDKQIELIDIKFLNKEVKNGEQSTNG